MSVKQHYRQIRSYVLREGRMTSRQKRALAELWSKFGIECREQLLDFEKIFARKAPLVLEIGFGMGQSLLQMARQHPQHNYVGIEVHAPGVGALLADLHEEGIENIRVIQQDAVEVLEHCIADNSLDKVQIYFPDPWPKKRHHKRRLIQPEFVALLIQKLKSNGTIHLATDWQNYAEHMLEVLSAAKFLENIAGEKQFMENKNLRPITKFEKRGERLGHDVWDLLFRKI